MIQNWKHASTEDRKSTNGNSALGFDNTDNVRYESMRNKMQHGRLYRRHQDLAREFERQIHTYDKSRDTLNTEVEKHKQKIETRLNRLISTSGLGQQFKYSHNHGTSIYADLKQHNHTKCVTKENRTTLLFSVMHRDGEEVYVERTPESYQSFEEYTKATRKKQKSSKSNEPKSLKYKGKSMDDGTRPRPVLVRESTM